VELIGASASGAIVRGVGRDLSGCAMAYIGLDTGPPRARIAHIHG